jgi:hypothetical protein
MKPTSSDVHVNTPLTNISVAFLQNAANFVSDRVFPNVPVMKQSDRYYTYDRGYFNRDEMAIRAPGTESAGGHYSVDNTPTYYAPVYAFHHDIDDQRRANEDSVLDSDREATELVTLKALIKREKLWVTNFFTGGLWTTDLDGVDSGPTAGEFLQWDDSDSTPLEDIRAEKGTILELTGFEPNTLVVGYPVWQALVDHPDIVDRVKYGQTGPGPARVTVEAVAALLELDRLLVMKAIQNTALEGATNDHSFIGGKKALLCYAAPSPGLMTPTAGYTFSWNGYLGAGPQGQRISKFRMEHLKSDRVEIEMAFNQKLVSADLGAFFDTAVA